MMSIAIDIDIVCIYLHFYIYTHDHNCVYVHVHPLRLQIFKYTFELINFKHALRANIAINIHIVHVCMHIHDTCLCTCIYTRTYICICIFMHAYICAYTYTVFMILRVYIRTYTRTYEFNLRADPVHIYLIIFEF